MTCWELLRRGKPVSDIRAWWDERNEQWRSVLLRTCDPSSGEAVQSPWLRMMNVANKSDWIICCEGLALSKDVHDPFQKAVYGLLCGRADISNKVCETLDEL
ncbi:MAG: Nucleoporin nup84, partial [Watsoniomyces obsoletus]